VRLKLLSDLIQVYPFRTSLQKTIANNSSTGLLGTINSGFNNNQHVDNTSMMDENSSNASQTRLYENMIFTTEMQTTLSLDQVMTFLLKVFSSPTQAVRKNACDLCVKIYGKVGHVLKSYLRNLQQDKPIIYEELKDMLHLEDKAKPSGMRLTSIIPGFDNTLGGGDDFNDEPNMSNRIGGMQNNTSGASKQQKSAFMQFIASQKQFANDGHQNEVAPIVLTQSPNTGNQANSNSNNNTNAANTSAPAPATTTAAAAPKPRKSRFIFS